MDEIKHPAKVDYKAGFDEAMTQLNAEIKENAILTAERDALKVKLAEYGRTRRECGRGLRATAADPPAARSDWWSRRRSRWFSSRARCARG